MKLKTVLHEMLFMVVGIDDFTGLFQPKCFCDLVILSCDEITVSWPLETCITNCFYFMSL